MKKIIFVFTSLSLSFVSCNNSGNNNEATPVSDSVTSDAGVSKAVLSSGCYSMIQQKDTALLNVTVLDTILSGRLQYRRLEKDDNDGVIDGVIRDGFLIANYTFESEGRTSVRQIVFSIKGDSLFEGYGEIIVEGDKARFANTDQLKFMTIPFIKIDCEGQP